MKTAVITGASGGIGSATALAFAKDGYNVVLQYNNSQDKALALAKKIENETNSTALPVKADVSSSQEVTFLFDEVENRFGNVDVLVNNAGLAQGLDPFQDSAVDDAVTMIDTNVKGLLYVTKAVLPFMIDKNEGHIVNMGSTAGIYAYPGGAVYCATKAAVKMLADGIRMDTIATDIKVTTIQPGIVETPFSEVRFHGDAERAKAVYAGIEAVQPEDVADVVLYVTNQPKRLQISDVTIMANQQAAGFMVHKK